jgi:hypothetical protein
VRVLPSANNTVTTNPDRRTLGRRWDFVMDGVLHEAADRNSALRSKATATQADLRGCTSGHARCRGNVETLLVVMTQMVAVGAT